MTDSTDNGSGKGSKDPIKIAGALLVIIAVIMLLLLLRNCVTDDPHYNSYEPESPRLSTSPSPDNTLSPENNQSSEIKN